MSHDDTCLACADHGTAPLYTLDVPTLLGRSPTQTAVVSAGPSRCSLPGIFSAWCASHLAAGDPSTNCIIHSTFLRICLLVCCRRHVHHHILMTDRVVIRCGGGEFLLRLPNDRWCQRDYARRNACIQEGVGRVRKSQDRIFGEK